MDIYRKKIQKVKEKKQPGREPTHTVEYMSMVAKKVTEEGMTYREASKTFGISQGAIAQWKKKYLDGVWMNHDRTKHKGASEARVHILSDQVKELKQEIGELYLENLMLKKALYHSQQIKKENSSVITSENLAQFQEGAE